MKTRHAIPHNQCWHSLITKKMVRENPEQFRISDVGKFSIRECVDLFDEGQTVTKGDIQDQMDIWRTGVTPRLHAHHAALLKREVHV